MNILMIGGAGQLGQDVRAALDPHEVLAPSHAELDLTDEEALTSWIETHKPRAVVNLAAFHDVPRCEEEPGESFRINASGPRILATVCRRAAARLIHISTDYVFRGDKGAPYTEEDLPGPLMVYGASKLAGEHLALAANPQTIILRTAGLFGHHPCRAKAGGRSFVDLMLHLARTRGEVSVVDDQLSCPTFTGDLARQIAELVAQGAPPGVYHAVNGDGCSWYDFARLIFELAGVSPRLEAIPAADRPATFRRPADSRLANARLTRLGLNVMRPLAAALEDYFSAPAESA